MRARLWVLLGASALVGCASILGAPDLTYDPNATAGSDGGGASSGGADGSSGGVDGSSGGADGAGCAADVNTDGKNCGRCGHDCLGGTCTAGACDPVTLAQALNQPGGIALDDANVYFATAVSTAGATYSSPLGVAVDGTTLYIAAYAGSLGGIFTCSLASCDATLKRLTATAYDRFVEVANSSIYFTTESDVRRMQPDGGAEVAIGSATQPYALAVDATHVYFTSGQSQLQRVQIDGGAQMDVGALTSPTNVSFVAVDSDHYYWAFTDQATTKGQVLGGAKSAAVASLSFTSTGEDSLGVASDDVNVYWANGGTYNGSAANGDGQLLTCPKAGCNGAPRVLAKQLSGAGQIRTDANAIYWVEYGGGAAGAGRVRKVAKP
jgi:hypothetical protein